MDKVLSIKKNTIYNSIGAAVYLGCQWLITVVIVKIVSYEEAGNLSLAISITNMFFTVATFGIRNFQVSDYKEKYSVSIYVTTRIITSILALSLCTIFVVSNRSYTSYQILCIIIYMLFRLMEAFVDVLQGIQQKQERMDYICYSFISRGVLSFFVFCIFLYFTKKLIFAIIGMTCVSALIVFIYDYNICKKIKNFSIIFSYKQSLRLMQECLPLMMNSFLISSLVSIPRNTLEAVYGNYYLGIYASIATPAVIVQTAASWIYNPLITFFTKYYVEKEKEKYMKQYHKVWKMIFLVFVTVIIISKIFGKWGLTILFNEEIVQYSNLLIPVLLTTLSLACIYFLSALLTIARCLKTIVLVNLTSVLLVAFFSRIFIESFGMNGVNYVILLATGVNIMLLLITLKSVLKRNFN
ncbi:MAG: oligosaccharide flippase family protein [Lachnospiraceae bacterium]|jgi:O-antigen/teichoic acid export membrane protein|nr:oligosaccharide flippase family protein [Lachnospiraceae bacterium]